MATKHEVLQAYLSKWLACKGDKEKRGEMIKELTRLLRMHEKSVGRSITWKQGFQVIASK